MCSGFVAALLAASALSYHVPPHTSPAACSEVHQLLQLSTLLDEYSSLVSTLDLSFDLWYTTHTAQQLAALVAQHGSKLVAFSTNFKGCAADLSGGTRSQEAAAAAEELLAEALEVAGGLPTRVDAMPAPSTSQGAVAQRPGLLAGVMNQHCCPALQQ